MEINSLNASNVANSGLVSLQDNTLPSSYPTKSKGGRPKGSSNLHSKHPSSIAYRLKVAGIDWIADLAQALKVNDVTRINVWMRLLPYLVVTQGHRKPKHWKGRATKAAVKALEELEGR